jgi:hypothetical protein
MHVGKNSYLRFVGANWAYNDDDLESVEEELVEVEVDEEVIA